MHITEVRAVNFKGWTGKRTITPVTVITGENARGKSAVEQAVTIALANQITIDGKAVKQPRAIFDLFASGSTMAVGIEMDNANAIKREYLMKRDSVKAETTAFGFPDDFAMAPSLVDPAEALNLLTDVGYIFNRAKLSADLTLDKVAAAVTANAKNIKVETNTDDSEAAIAEMVKLIAAVKADDGNPNPPSVQSFISTLSEKTAAALKLANQNVVRLQKTLEGLTQTAVPENAQADAEARLAQVRIDLEAANAEVVRLIEVGQEFGRQIEAAEKVVADGVDQTEAESKIAEHERCIAVLKKTPEAGSKPKPAAMDSPKPSDAESSAAIAALRDNSNTANTAKSLAQAEVTRLTTEIENTEGATTCSKCKQSIIEILKPVIAGLKKTLKAATKTLTEATSVADEAQKQLEAGDRVLARDRQAIAEWEKQEMAIRKSNEDSIDNWNNLNVAFTEAQQAISRHNTAIAELRAKIGDNAATEARAKLPTLIQSRSDTRDKYLVAKQSADALRQTVQSVGEECQQLIAARARAQQRATTMAEHSKYKAQSDVLKLAVDMIETMQCGFVDEAVAPILMVANEFCRDILRLPLDYRDGQIGMNGPTGWVHNKSFSDSEKLVAYAGICIALAAESDFKLAVIGRFESFDFRKRKMLAARALDLTRAGTVHQVLFIEVQPTVDARTKADYGIATGEKDFSVIVV